MNPVILSMVITVYVVAGGGINGGSIYGKHWRGGIPLVPGDVACGPRYQFGTVFVILDDDRITELAKADVFICRDGGSFIGNRNLDVAIFSNDKRAAIAMAKQYGRQRRSVIVFHNKMEYNKWKRLTRME